MAGRSGHGIELFIGRSQCLATVSSSSSGDALMDILFLLIPLSVILVFFILGGLGWAIYRGQFEDIEAEAERILRDD